MMVMVMNVLITFENKDSILIQYIFFSSGLPTIFQLFAQHVPAEERSRAFGYMVAAGSVGQTVASLVSIN